MANPCIEDTQSIALSMDGDALQADARLDPAGALGVGTNGLFVALATTPGLQIAGDKLSVKVDGGGVVVTSAGLAKVNLASRTGWGPRSASGFEVVSQNVARGATADIATALGINISNTGPVAQRVTVISTWLIDYQTTFSAFETSNTFDGVDVRLQTNFNGGGYGDSDFDGLQTSGQSRRAMLKCIDNVSVPAEDTVSYQVKPVSVGYTNSVTAVQGHIKGRGAGSILVIQ